MPAVAYLNLDSNDLADPTLSKVNTINRQQTDEINRLGGLNGPVEIVSDLEVDGSVTATSITLGSIKISTGIGSPEGKVTAPPGSLYLNSSGGTNTTLFIKESGNGAIGWIAK